KQDNFPFLQHRLSASNFHQAAIWAEPLHFRLYLFQRHLASTRERVFAVAPVTTQVAARQAHKDTRQPGVGRLTLDRLEDFSDLNGGSIAKNVWFGTSICTAKQ